MAVDLEHSTIGSQIKAVEADLDFCVFLDPDGLIAQIHIFRQIIGARSNIMVIAALLGKKLMEGRIILALTGPDRIRNMVGIGDILICMISSIWLIRISQMNI